MSVTLQYPYTSPTQTVVLPNPELKDAHVYDLGIVSGIDEAGNLYTYIKTPVNERIEYIFDALTATDGANLYSLLVNYPGSYKLTDYRGEVYRVICLSNPFTFKIGKELINIKLEFDAVPVVSVPEWDWEDVT